MVLYNGSPRWPAATDAFSLIPPVPGLVEQFKLRRNYLRIDENAYTDRELASLQNLVAGVFRIEHPATPSAIGELLHRLDERLLDRPKRRRMFARRVGATSATCPVHRSARIDDAQEWNAMLAKRIEDAGRAATRHVRLLNPCGNAEERCRQIAGRGVRLH